MALVFLLLLATVDAVSVAREFVTEDWVPPDWMVDVVPKTTTGESLSSSLIQMGGDKPNMKALKKQSLLDAQAEQEARLADMIVNEVQLHEWSMNAREFASPKQAVATEAKPKVEAWFINTKKDLDRKRCMLSQLKQSGFAPLRFKGMELPACVDGLHKCYKAQSFVTKLGENFKDCVQNGLMALPGKSDESKRNIYSNWCSHKRLFEALEAAPSTADYFLVLEDTPVIGTASLKPIINDFITNFKRQPWDMLQIDPYGGTAEPIHFHNGRPIFRASKGALDADQYKGSHAFLVKKSALRRLNEWMSEQRAQPFSLIAQQEELNVLSMSAGVAINPMIITEFHQHLTLPATCPSTVHVKSPELRLALSTVQKRGHGYTLFHDFEGDDHWANYPRFEAESKHEGEQKKLKKWEDPAERFNPRKLLWHVPKAAEWVHFSDLEAREAHTPYLNFIQQDKIQAVLIGGADEDPARSTCLKNELRKAGFKSKSYQMVTLPAVCSAPVVRQEEDGEHKSWRSAIEYKECLRVNGMADCAGLAGDMHLADIKNITDFQLRAKVRDAAVASTCSYYRILKQVRKDTDSSNKVEHYLFLQENAVIDMKHAERKLRQFIVDTRNVKWTQAQIDPYGDTSPINQNFKTVSDMDFMLHTQQHTAEAIQGGKVKQLSDVELVHQLWGMHASLIKVEGMDRLINEMSHERKFDQSAGHPFGPADRIPRHTSGWVAGNIGVAFDPHMADMTNLDKCKGSPSTAAFHQIPRATIPGKWIGALQRPEWKEDLPKTTSKTALLKAIR